MSDPTTGIQLEMDEQLKEQILAQQPAALQLLWEALYPHLVRYVANKLQRHYQGRLNPDTLEEEADRISVEIMDHLLNNALRTYQPGQPFRNWMYTVAKNKLISLEQRSQQQLEREIGLFHDGEVPQNEEHPAEKKARQQKLPSLDDLQTGLRRFALDNPQYRLKSQQLIDFIRWSIHLDYTTKAVKISAKMGESTATVCRLKSFFQKREIITLLNKYIDNEWLHYLVNKPPAIRTGNDRDMES